MEYYAIYFDSLCLNVICGTERAFDDIQFRVDILQASEQMTLFAYLEQVSSNIDKGLALVNNDAIHLTDNMTLEQEAMAHGAHTDEEIDKMIQKLSRRGYYESRYGVLCTHQGENK